MHIETLKVFCDWLICKVFRLRRSGILLRSRRSASRFRTLEDKFKRRLLERVRGRREVK